jgi:peptidoglycan/LPS O-acetylase OafA/YrhL
MSIERADVAASVFGPQSVISSLVALGLALGTVIALGRWFQPLPASNRYRSIDGLRGYLALFVFLHHAAIWSSWLGGGQWEPPASRFFNHLGGVSVILFFMITSFLFFSRILDARAGGAIDWGRLYLSRIFRIAPLYLVSTLLVGIIVLGCCGWQLSEHPASLVGNALRMLMLGVFPLRPLNGFAETERIVAGVYWTLSYEWFFYGMLPLLALLCGVRVPAKYCAVLLLSGLWFLRISPPMVLLMPFAGGVAAAVLVRSEFIRRICRSAFASLLIPLLLGLGLTYHFSPYARINIVFLTAVFILIAGGNSFFGLLVNRAALLLGELAYGVYLLHGILLFLSFRVLTPEALHAKLPSGAFWAIVILLTPLLIVLSLAANRWIEKPGIRCGKVFADWLGAMSARRQREGSIAKLPPPAGRPTPVRS